MTDILSGREQALLEQGFAFHQQGRIADAASLYRQVLQTRPRNADALCLLGTAESQLGQFADSAVHLSQSLEIAPDQPDVHYNLGTVLQTLGRLDEALASYGRALDFNPGHVEARLNRSTVLKTLGRHDEALATVDRVLSQTPNFAAAHYNRGLILQSLRALPEALASFDEAVRLDGHMVDGWFDRSNLLMEMRRFGEALDGFDRVLQLRTTHAGAWGNRGLVLGRLGRLGDARDSLDRAVANDPTDADAYGNRATILRLMGDYEAALADGDRAIALQPGHAQAHYGRGLVLDEMDRLPEALSAYNEALRLNPLLDGLQGWAQYVCARLADWSDFQERRTRMAAALAAGHRVATPQSVLDDPELQRRATAGLAAEAPARSAPVFPPRPPGGRLRVAYISSDFGNHPVSHLMAGVLERHDRARFEIFAVSTAVRPSEAWRARIQAAVEHFVDAAPLPDARIAQNLREAGIDIAVDLNGWTKGNRTEIFAERAAPVQVSYLGFLGSMETGYHDYLLADRVIVPEENQRFYGEKIVYLPSYQVNDDAQKPSDKAFTRADFDLPEGAFVFCSFNQTYKLTPDVFDSWMRILGEVPGSVLWLLARHPTARDNLRAEAGKRGIDPARLIFADTIPLEDHLARLPLADLFLDSHPYNAGATASAALRMGVPVLTRIGQSFAARMGASLLTAVGMPELITETSGAYEALAIRLATRPDEMTAIKQKLAGNLPGSLLFDTERATRALEAVFEDMVAAKI